MNIQIPGLQAKIDEGLGGLSPSEVAKIVKAGGSVVKAANAAKAAKPKATTSNKTTQKVVQTGVAAKRAAKATVTNNKKLTGTKYELNAASPSYGKYGSSKFTEEPAEFLKPTPIKGKSIQEVLDPNAAYTAYLAAQRAKSAGQQAADAAAQDASNEAIKKAGIDARAAASANSARRSGASAQTTQMVSKAGTGAARAAAAENNKSLRGAVSSAKKSSKSYVGKTIAETTTGTSSPQVVSDPNGNYANWLAAVENSRKVDAEGQKQIDGAAVQKAKDERTISPTTGIPSDLNDPGINNIVNKQNEYAATLGKTREELTPEELAAPLNYSHKGGKTEAQIEREAIADLQREFGTNFNGGIHEAGILSSKPATGSRSSRGSTNNTGSNVTTYNRDGTLALSAATRAATVLTPLETNASGPAESIVKTTGAQVSKSGAPEDIDAQLAVTRQASKATDAATFNAVGRGVDAPQDINSQSAVTQQASKSSGATITDAVGAGVDNPNNISAAAGLASSVSQGNDLAYRKATANQIVNPSTAVAATSEITKEIDNTISIGVDPITGAKLSHFDVQNARAAQKHIQDARLRYESTATAAQGEASKYNLTAPAAEINSMVASTILDENVAQGITQTISEEGLPSLDSIELMPVKAIASIADLPEEALVTSQMDTLLAGMEDGNIPTWALPAVEAVEANLKARGMSSSTVGRNGLFAAIVSSAIPLAQSNAQALQARAAQNLSNKQQAGIVNAQLGTQIVATEAEINSRLAGQKFQTAADIRTVNGQLAQQMQLANMSEENQVKLANMQSLNASATANLGAAQQTELANLQSELQVGTLNAQLAQEMGVANLSARQQTAISNAATNAQLDFTKLNMQQQVVLANSQWMQTSSLANLNNEQQATIQEATLLAQTDMAAADLNTKLKIENAQNFLTMDLTNLSNEQQTNVLNAQAKQQVLLSDNSAKNAASQFNATSQSQTDQFMEGLAAQIKIQNSASINAMSQFNVAQKNAAATQSATNTLAASVETASNITSASLANAQLGSDVSKFNSAQETQRSQFNAAQTNQTSQFNTAQKNSLAAQDASNSLTASVETSRAATSASLTNAQLGSDVSKFNSAQETQRSQFNAAQTNQVSQFNTAQENAMSVQNIQNEIQVEAANAAAVNSINQFNSQQDFSRNQWNAANAQAVEQSNIQWRRTANTANTAASNAINQQNAINSFNLEKSELDFIWQELRDQAAFDQQDWTNYQNQVTNLYATALSHEGYAARSEWSKVETLVTTLTNAFDGAE